MPKSEITVSENGSDTQTRILDTALALFALKGFKAVSMKEISKIVGVKIPSLYYYFEDKEALIQAVLSYFADGFKACHDWLAMKNEQAESLEDVIGNLFDQEFYAELGPTARFGMSMIFKEQHHHESAYHSVVRHIYDDGIQNIQAGFDRLINKGVIPPSDTNTLATIFMFCVICGNEIQMHDITEQEAPVESQKVYNGLKKLMVAALRQGIIGFDNEI